MEIMPSTQERINDTIGEMGLDSKGYRDDRSENPYDASSEWFEEHSAETPRGSRVIGTMHGKDEELEEVKIHILPKVLSGAKELLDQGKKIVFLAEGAIHGTEGSEQNLIASELDNMSNKSITHDTWDDENVEFCSYDENGKDMGLNFDSRMVKKLIAKFGKKEEIEAALYATMRAQNDTFPISEEAKYYLENTIGVDLNDAEKLAELTFNASEGQEGTLTKIMQTWNRLRQENLLRKIKEIEDRGSVAIVTPGYSHAYSLKHVLERGNY